MKKITNLAPLIKVVPALCLDLDGTVRKSKSGQVFIKNAKDIVLIEGIEKIIWKYRDMGWLILGISNAGGVAHGYKLPQEINFELKATIALFEKNPFDMIKLCMHDGAGKVEPYNHRSLLRKPQIGMLAIMEEHCFAVLAKGIDWDKSIFVGDRTEDEQCAQNAGIRFFHIDRFLRMPHIITV